MGKIGRRGSCCHRKGEPQCQVQMTGAEGDLECLVKEWGATGGLYDQLRSVLAEGEKENGVEQMMLPLCESFTSSLCPQALSLRPPYNIYK